MQYNAVQCSAVQCSVSAMQYMVGRAPVKGPSLAWRQHLQFFGVIQNDIRLLKLYTEQTGRDIDQLVTHVSPCSASTQGMWHRQTSCLALSFAVSFASAKHNSVSNRQ